MTNFDEPVRSRVVSRVILVDADQRILLFDTKLAYTRAWIAPGGGLEPGESAEEGALRELEEETGVRGVTLGPCIWTLGLRYRVGGVVYDQRERYFPVRIDAHRVRTDRWTETESDEIQEHRWWSLQEIAASTADFRPANLSSLLIPVLAGRYPAVPLEAPAERSARTP